MRAFVVFTRLFPFVIACSRDRKRFLLIGRPRRVAPEVHRTRARRLTIALAELGPTFIKLAQVFASRADILPEPYLSEVGALTDRVPPISLAEVEGVIEREYGRPAQDMFAALEPEPLAAASLGQVQRARLDDREVVV